jgi:hypothetical protein
MSSSDIKVKGVLLSKEGCWKVLISSYTFSTRSFIGKAPLIGRKAA